MNDQATQLLEQLKDIHGTAAPGWWPPAPGWWVLAALLLLLLLVAGRRLMAWLAVRRRKRQWFQLLGELGADARAQDAPADWLAEINRLFRAIALRAFPNTACGRLEGPSWVAFIRGLLPENNSGDSLDALAVGPYQPDPEFDRESLLESARLWVTRYG